MPDPSLPAPPSTRSSGRRVTLVFLGLLAATLVAGYALRQANERDRTGAALLAVSPLGTQLKFECAAPTGDPVPFKSGDHCPAGGTLRLTVEKVDSDVAELAYAWVTPDSDTLGALVKTPGLTTGLPLGKTPGERFLVLIAAQRPTAPVPLSRALEPLPPGSAPRHRAGALRGHAATLVREGIHARSEILKVVVP